MTVAGAEAWRDCQGDGAGADVALPGGPGLGMPCWGAAAAVTL